MEKPSLTSKLYNRRVQFPAFDWKDSWNTAEVIHNIHPHTRPFVDDRELGLLYEMGRGFYNQKQMQGFVIEFGSMWGGTASALALVLRDSVIQWPLVFTVDSYGAPDPNIPEGWYYVSRTADCVEAQETFSRLNLMHVWICQMIAYTHDIFLSLWAKPIRVLFINSGHIYELMLMEINNTMPYMEEDSWIIFHDYVDNGRGEGVIPVVNEWLDEHRLWNASFCIAGDIRLAVHLRSKKA